MVLKYRLGYIFFFSFSSVGVIIPGRTSFISVIEIIHLCSCNLSVLKYVSSAVYLES